MFIDIKIVFIEAVFFTAFGFWLLSLDTGSMFINLLLAFISLMLGVLKGNQVYEAYITKR